ncbi:MAG: hypothetical protein QM726_10625 [Chitinophagaceae bacterium]
MIFVIASCEMSGQLLPIGYNYVMASIKRKEHFLKKVSFGDGFSMLGLVPDADTTTVFRSLCFEIDSAAQYKLIQKEWYGWDKPDSLSDQHIYRLYIIKDHEIKKEWNVFPAVALIYHNYEYYSFDTALLRTAAIKYPLNYTVKVDSFSSNEAFLQFKTAAKNNPSFLFLKDPAKVYEGSFEVSVNLSEKIATNEDAGKALMAYCAQAAKKSRFGVFHGTDDAGNLKVANFIVKTDKEFYNRFEFTTSTKGLWKPELLIVKSYWRNE